MVCKDFGNSKKKLYLCTVKKLYTIMYRYFKLYVWTLIVSVFAIIPKSAQAASVYRDSCYAVGMTGGYAYNNTYQHYGHISVDAFLPITNYFDAEVNIRTSTANVHDFAVHLHPKIILPVGELFLATRIQYNLFARNEFHSLSTSFSVGYRMDYISAEVGYGSRVGAFIDLSKHTAENGVSEPHNLVYRVEVFARPPQAKWNISAYVTNITEYQMERMFTPIFGLRTTADIKDHWRLVFEGRCKPVGVSNFVASFYGAEGVIGLMYRF